MITSRDYYPEITDIIEDKNGNISCFVSALGESFECHAKYGEYARVEWLDPHDHNHKRREHQAAQSFATRHFITGYNRLKKNLGI